MEDKLKKIKFPKSLEKGDNVYLLCPSSAMNPNNVDKCCEKIRQLGFNPIIGKSVLKNTVDIWLENIKYELKIFMKHLCVVM